MRGVRSAPTLASARRLRHLDGPDILRGPCGAPPTGPIGFFDLFSRHALVTLYPRRDGAARDRGWRSAQAIANRLAWRTNGLGTHSGLRHGNGGPRAAGADRIS